MFRWAVNLSRDYSALSLFRLQLVLVAFGIVVVGVVIDRRRPVASFVVVVDRTAQLMVFAPSTYSLTSFASLALELAVVVVVVMLQALVAKDTHKVYQREKIINKKNKYCNIVSHVTHTLFSWDLTLFFFDLILMQFIFIRFFFSIITLLSVFDCF